MFDIKCILIYFKKAHINPYPKTNLKPNVLGYIILYL